MGDREAECGAEGVWGEPFLLKLRNKVRQRSDYSMDRSNRLGVVGWVGPFFKKKKVIKNKIQNLFAWEKGSRDVGIEGN